MSIPFYFAMEESEAEPQAGKRYAQLGFGFHENGTLRLPTRTILNAPAVINDRFLPAKVPESAVLDRLAEACSNGCFLDFERQLNEVSAAIAVGLQQRLNAKMTVPTMLHRLCPDADVQIPGLLCNHWEKFVQRMQVQYGDHWVLEIIPWNVIHTAASSMEERGYLQPSECNYRAENKTVIYYDTKESIKRKLATAEKYGCQAGISLLREYNTMID